MRIRTAVTSDFERLPGIERAASRRFRDIGTPEIADDAPFTFDELADHQRASTVWVAADEKDRPVAHLVAERVDGALHVEQVSVHPDHARRGAGRSLLDHPADAAGAEGYPR